MMRDRPPDEPSWCARPNASRPRTPCPRRASWYAVALPIAPSPMTMTSYTDVIRLRRRPRATLLARLGRRLALHPPVRAREEPGSSMHRSDGKLIVSATDLVGFLECGHLTELERAAVAGLIR